MKIEISLGELVDKATILAIKLEKFKNEEKKKNVLKEFGILSKHLSKVDITPDNEDFKKLKEINLKLWEIEDRIRFKEVKKEFDDTFIQLARNIYFTNDTRATIKKDINLRYGSELIEEKEYVNYKNG